MKNKKPRGNRMAKIKFKVLVEELDATKPKATMCWDPPLFCDVLYLIGPV
jgi:hypothetical protein